MDFPLVQILNHRLLGGLLLDRLDEQGGPGNNRRLLTEVGSKLELGQTSAPVLLPRLPLARARERVNVPLT